MAIAVETAFGWAGLKPLGPVAWGVRVEEGTPGVYVVALSEGAELGNHAPELRGLQPEELVKWVPGERIVYIGRTKRALRRRLGEFYRHIHGRSAPHRGGQAVLLLHMLRIPLCVYWASTDRSPCAEHRMIQQFIDLTGYLPYANRNKGWGDKLKSR